MNAAREIIERMLEKQIQKSIARREMTGTFLVCRFSERASVMERINNDKHVQVCNGLASRGPTLFF